jgi:hypothetical protein
MVAMFLSPHFSLDRDQSLYLSVDEIFPVIMYRYPSFVAKIHDLKGSINRDRHEQHRVAILILCRKNDPLAFGKTIASCMCIHTLPFNFKPS